MKSSSFRRKSKKLFWIMLCTGFLFLYPTRLMATGVVAAIDESLQEQQVKGIVVDATGESIIGANVIVEGTSIGTITDVEGRFSLTVPKGKKLKVSFIGYKDYVVSRFTAKEELRIVLEDDSQLLGEVECS